jgi:hypothetical protein
MKPLVGVLGCNGVIGYEVCIHLSKECKIRGGQRRNPEKLKELENFEWMYLDLYDDKNLYEFCKECDVVVNCAGPAYKIKDRVAHMAAKVGAVYVDASDVIMIDENLKNTLEPEGVYVVAAGYVPGISGVIPRMIAETEFECIDALYCFQGGRQKFSDVAFTDIILSSIKKSGYPNACYKNGKIETYIENIGEKIALPGLDEKVYVKAFLSKEMEKVAQDLKIGEMHWYNIAPDQKMMELIMDSFEIMMTVDYDAGVEKIREKCRETFQNFMLDEGEWSVMIFEFFGEYQGKKKRKRVLFNLEKEEQVCGQMVVETVKAVLARKLPSGIYWSSEVVQLSEKKYKGATRCNMKSIA